MDETPKSLLSYLAVLEDPRREGSTDHPLASVLFIALGAMLCGAETFVAMARWGQAKEEWLSTFLELPNGIPSHDTFGRVFAALHPDAFAEMFTRWIADVAQMTEGEIVAIDGKTLRRSLDRANHKAAVHMINAWAVGNGLVLGQLRTDPESNEITAVPRLLDLLDVTGCLVTLDAISTQRAIAAKIVEKGADYVLPLKDNHPTLLDEVRSALEQAISTDFRKVKHHDYAESEEAAHGRYEKRCVWSMPCPKTVDKNHLWESICGIAKIQRTRTLRGETSVEDSYYITSLSGKDAKKLMDAIRAHWNVENQLHWRLDVQFDEDSSRVRAGNAAENLGRLRQMALNLLTQEKSAKVGIKTKRLMAGWDHSYLLKLVGIGAK